MALHFVSSSILSSSDGVEFNEEVILDTEETRKQKLKAEQDSKKSLYSQLQERQAAKDEEFEANRKKLYATATLDEEDVAFMEELESKQVKLKSARALDEEKALEHFRQAKSETVYSALPTNNAALPLSSEYALNIPLKPEKSILDIAPVIILKKKRKIESVSTEEKVEPPSKAPSE